MAEFTVRIKEWAKNTLKLNKPASVSYEVKAYPWLSIICQTWWHSEWTVFRRTGSRL